MYLVGLGLHKHRVHAVGKISRVKKMLQLKSNVSIMKKKLQRNTKQQVKKLKI